MLRGRRKGRKLFFQEDRNALPPAPATGLALHDFNADARPDVFLSGGEDQPGRLYLNQPGGRFRPAVHFPAVTGLYGAAAAGVPAAPQPVLLAAARQPADPVRVRTALATAPNLLAWPVGNGFQQQAFLRNAAATDWSWGATWTCLLYTSPSPRD